jgi:predicted O-linked N-acetylglucosamine transferase (SPINDLY family)
MAKIIIGAAEPKRPKKPRLSIRVGARTAVQSPTAPPEELFDQGRSLHQQGNLTEAAKAYQRLLDAHPNYVEGLHLFGILNNQLGRRDDAVEYIARAAAFEPGNFGIQNNLGNALKDIGRLEEAITHYDKALALKPDSAESYSNKGIALRTLNRFRAAGECFAKAIELCPDEAKYHFNLGNTFLGVHMYRDAFICFSKALTLDPDMDLLPGNCLLCMQQLCDWKSWNAILKKVIGGIEAGKMLTPPFPPLTSVVPAALKKRAAEIYTERNFPRSERPLWTGQKYDHDKIRVGYLSADFRRHAVSYLTAELYERHDRAAFEVHGFSLTPNDYSEIQKRVMGAFDHFHDLETVSDEDISALIRELEIDVPIDLGGHTSAARTGILSRRPAPVQINFLGFPGTMGASYIDYIIGDANLIPPEHQAHYSEKVLYMPECYQPTDTKKTVSEKAISRADCGLSETGFVFCCFNNNFKFTPDVFDLWMKILKEVEDSQLWLVEMSKQVKENLNSEAEKRGIDSKRLVFAQHVPYPEHLARHRCADLFLDTFHYNAGTMASKALWMGLPILTYPGDSFSNRMASSLLTDLKLPELIAASPEDYLGKAVELARSKEKLSDIHKKLAANRETSPLFDMARYTKHLEAAYAAIVQRTQEGLPPDHIELKPLAK